MRWAVLWTMLGCAAPPETLVVWVSEERLLGDVPDARGPLRLLAGWENWRAHDEWEAVAGWKRLRFELPPGRYRYVLAVGETLIADPLVAGSVFVRDPLGRDDDPYGVEVSELELPRRARPTVTPPDGLIYQVVIDRF